MNIFKKLYKGQAFLIGMLLFFLPRKIRAFLSYIIALPLCLIEILFLFIITSITVVTLTLRTEIGTLWLTELTQNIIVNISPESIPGFAISLDELSLNHGISIKNFKMRDAQGVCLEVDSLFIDFPTFNLFTDFTKVIIPNIIIDNASYYRNPATIENADDNEDSSGLMIPNFIVPLPLWALAIENLELNNAFVAAGIMKLEEYPLDIVANLKANALFEYQQAIINLKLDDKNVYIAGTVTYTPHQLYADLHVEDRIWVKVFPKIDRGEVNLKATVKARELPPSRKNPLTVNFHATTKFYDIMWLNHKRITPTISTNFSFDGTTVRCENTTAKDANFSIYIPYFALNLDTSTFAKSTATVHVEDLNLIVPVLQGKARASLVFQGTLDEMIAEAELKSSKLLLANETTNFIEGIDTSINTNVHIITNEPIVRVVGNLNVNSERLFFFESGDKAYLQLSTGASISSEEILLSELELKINDFSLLSSSLNLNLKNMTENSLPRIKGFVQINADNLSFLGENFPVDANGSASLMFSEKEENQELTVKAHIQPFNIAGMQISILNLNATMSDTDRFLQGQFPSINGYISSSALTQDITSSDILPRTLYEFANLNFSLENHQNTSDIIFSLETEGNIDTRISGHFNPLELNATLNRLFVKFLPTNQTITLEKRTNINFSNGLHITPTSISIRENRTTGRISVEGFFTKNATDFKAGLDLPFQLLNPYLNLSGFLSSAVLKSNVEILGTGHNPKGNISLALTNLSTNESANMSLNLKGEIEDKKLQWTADFGVERKKGLQAEGSLVLDFNPYPNVNMDAPLFAQINWRGNIANLWNFAQLAGRNLSGNSQFDCEITGTLAKPKINGKAYLSKALFEDYMLSYSISDINMELDITESKLDVKLTARDGTMVNPTSKTAGTLFVNGSVYEMAGQYYLNTNLALDRFSPIRQDNLLVILSGTVSATGLLQSPMIMGAITLNQAEYRITTDASGGTSVKNLPNVVITKNKQFLQEQEIKERQSVGFFNPILNLQIRVPSSVKVGGIGLESRWKGTLAVLGTLNNPLLFGNLEPVEGSLELLGKTFTLDRSVLVFSGSIEMPVYNIVFSRSGTSIETIVTVSGAGTSPNLELTSVPAYPTDEIIARTIYGKSLAELSQFETIQVATTVAELTSPSLARLNLLNTTKNALGLQVLRLNSRTTTTTTTTTTNEDGTTTTTENTNELDNITIEAGKYLTDKVYVGVERGLEDTSVILEVEVFTDINANIKVGTESSQFGIVWKKDY